MNRRRLFAARGYGSLFDYCVRGLGYSVHGDLPLGDLFARALETHLERTDPLRKAARAAEREKARAQRAATPAPELDRKPDSKVEPFALEGSHAARNLRLVCPQHQRLAAIEAFGAARMAPYLRERPLERPAGGFASRS